LNLGIGRLDDSAGPGDPMPPDAAAAAADRVISTPRPLRRWMPPQGVRLVATDTDWAYGTGQERPAPMQAHLLTLTGRPTTPGRLHTLREAR